MKKRITCANKFTNKATQLASKVYTPKRIIKNSLIGSHNGEPMIQVFMNIINDPDIQFGEMDKNGNATIYFKGYNVGWINPVRCMGWIDDKAYPNIRKFDMSQLEAPQDSFNSFGQLDAEYDDEYDEYDDESYDNGYDDGSDFYDDGDNW